MQAYDRALLLDPDDMEAYCAMATALSAKGNYGRAVGCYDRALAIDPDYMDARIGREIAARKQASPPRAC